MSRGPDGAENAPAGGARGPDTSPEAKAKVTLLGGIPVPENSAIPQYLGGAQTTSPDKSNQAFRALAVRNLEQGKQDGDLLEISPGWTRWTYWLLVAVFFSAFAFSIFGRMHEYSSGQAVVWVTGRVAVTAIAAGTVASIDVMPGQHVLAGTLLARFDTTRESSELERIQREFDLQLVKSLRDPSDANAREILTALRTQRDLAIARVEQLSVRAPKAGFVGDIRIRRGQLLAAGDVVVSLVADDTKYGIVAMLPAQYRPQLVPGMTLRFEVSGYRYAYQEMPITSVSSQIIGPNEVKRYLGQELDDTVKVEGPIVLVEATPPSPTFEVDGQTYHLYHGMAGTAEARIRSEPIILALIPGLRALVYGTHDEAEPRR